MLLGNKKNQEKEQNWSLVLNPVSNEIDRHKLSQRIAEAFHLSLDEALDLVRNTPIILLDNMSRDAAAKAKDYFGGLNGEMFLTNDVYVKRKCYRTVWPEQPDLSFLEEPRAAAMPVSQPVATPQYKLKPEEALYELRSLQDPQAKIETQNRKESASPGKGEDPARDFSQIRRLEKEASAWREKFELLERESEHLRRSLAEHENRASESGRESARAADLEKELRSQKEQIKSAEQKFLMLQDEYRQARTLYESKIGAAQEEGRRLKTRADEIQQKLKQAETERQAAEKLLKDHEQALDSAGSETKNLSAEIESLKLRKHQIQEEVENRNRSLQDAAERIHFLETDIMARSRETELAAENCRQLERELESFQTRGSEQEAMLERARQDLAAAAKTVSLLETEAANLREQARFHGVELRARENKIIELQKLSQELENRARSDDELRRQALADYGLLAARYNELESQAGRISAGIEAERADFASQMAVLQNRIEALQDEREDFDHKTTRLTSEIQDALRAAGDWKTKAEAFEREIQDMKQVRVGQDSLMADKNRQLEDRDRELEVLRRQVRELNVRLEQRDALHKREQLNEQLSQKEERLKSLVGEQSSLEAEMRQREEKMRGILNEQEKIEKEIVEARQAQRHYLEQARREKNGPVKSSRPSVSGISKPAAPDQEPGA